MNCSNCGAIMKFDVNSHIYRCTYCGNHLGLDRDSGRIEVLESLSETLCPLCRQPMRLAALNRYEISYCPACKGIWLQQEVFGEIVEWERASATGDGTIPPAERPDEERAPLGCPRCRHLMDKHLYGGPGNVFVDTCRDCQFIWLDGGELERVIASPGRDRGIPRHLHSHAPEPVGIKPDPQSSGTVELFTVLASIIEKL